MMLDLLSLAYHDVGPAPRGSLSLFLLYVWVLWGFCFLHALGWLFLWFLMVFLWILLVLIVWRNYTWLLLHIGFVRGWSLDSTFWKHLISLGHAMPHILITLFIDLAWYRTLGIFSTKCFIMIFVSFDGVVVYYNVAWDSMVWQSLRDFGYIGCCIDFIIWSSFEWYRTHRNITCHSLDTLFLSCGWCVTV